MRWPEDVEPTRAVAAARGRRLAGEAGGARLNDGGDEPQLFNLSLPSAAVDSDQVTSYTRGRISSRLSRSGVPPSKAPKSSASLRFA